MVKNVVLLLVGFLSAAEAQDLGVFGETFPIQEKSLIQVIQEKLQKLQDTGALAAAQTLINKRIKEGLENPKAVEGITATVIPRIFTYDPSFVLAKDLQDHKGKVFHKAGTRINPLIIKPLTKALLYIDGSDPAQLVWVEKELKKDAHAKVILVKGSPFKLMESMKRQVYFDQAGVSVNKFGIRHVPARVIQKLASPDGEVLEISEELASPDLALPDLVSPDLTSPDVAKEVVEEAADED
ncbi:MAG: type-F conjugative transfer system protein TraW [Alphaproteobacteria bacterium]